MRTARSARAPRGASALRTLGAVLTAFATFLGLVALGSVPAQAGPLNGQAGRQANAQSTGLHISNGRLLEGNGNDFVMRGVNHAHTWFPNETQSLDDIKALGANTVRVVLSDGYRWTENTASDVTRTINHCKADKLICVLEVHDTTGYGEDSAAGTLDHATDYWIKLKSVLAGQEDYVVINIGNEPWGNTDPAGWTAPTKAAIQKLRNAGLSHTIMVDAPNWGQDWQGVMRDNAQSVYSADPTGNLIFSIHMYSVYDTAQEINDYLNHFVDAGLPIVVGEFGGPADQYGDPDEATVMAAAQRLNLGWIAWSWSGNNDPALDLAVNFDPGQLSGWGNRIFHGADGIDTTSREATVFSGGGTPDTEPPTTPAQPTGNSRTPTSVTIFWGESTDNVGVAGYDVVRIDADGSETPATTSPASLPTATVNGLLPGTTYTFAVYARDAAGNRSARSASVTVTTMTNGTTLACSVRYHVVNEWPGGFQAEIVIGNTGTDTIGNWTLGFTFPDGQRVTNMWGGTPTQTGSDVSVAAASYTSTIPVNGSVGVGFTGSLSGSANSAPDAFTLSGSACTTV